MIFNKQLAKNDATSKLREEFNFHFIKFSKKCHSIPKMYFMLFALKIQEDNYRTWCHYFSVKLKTVQNLGSTQCVLIWSFCFYYRGFIGVVSQPCTFSSLELGYVCTPEGQCLPVQEVDLPLWQHGEDGQDPKDFAFRFKAEDQWHYIQVSILIRIIHTSQ